MSIREVKAFFAARGMEDRVLEFDTSSATVELAAQTVGVIPARIAKTLSFMTPDGPLLGVPLCGKGRGENLPGSFAATFFHGVSRLRQQQQRHRADLRGAVCPFRCAGVGGCLQGLAGKRAITEQNDPSRQRCCGGSI